MGNKGLFGKNSLYWWIDYMEKDVTPDIKTNIEMLLNYSLTDRLIIGNLRRLKEIIWSTRNQDLPTSDAYYTDLKQKIMNQVVDSRAAGPAKKKTILKRIRL